MELFENHNLNTTVVTTNYFITNRYYLMHHFPDKLNHFLDITDILANNIFVDEQDAFKELILQAEKNIQLILKTKKEFLAINRIFYGTYTQMIIC
ncbi:hypothetical protein [Leuconostoc mesenteroides]|jgi:hypothetical protein|uniref:hypothetical protein n=1 Tax=Leuconostoc mesenteroides TaxID=1245 RepID=UPI000ABC790B|nr:hypothetical protein [Leuconostoc mesenteroides]MCH3953465.1 hypothetical protein [Leuconostoc mesenteroides]MCI2152901.1 hypothetical protein [Leuconostoc mesenteroides]MCI2167901.1 hypothetical protein [Leuconostoc mesenteroides]MCJ2158648.1 hypothetical protein [Leuconostoc mesenteroides]MCM6831846.1 hypothetical protein [Leuconostoc mesenteroides]